MSWRSFLVLIAVLATGCVLPRGWAQARIYNPEAAKASADETIAQALARLEFRPAFGALMTVISDIKKARPSTATVTAEADALVAEGNRMRESGQTDEANLALYHAISLLLGRPWSAESEFASALSLQLPAPLADSSTKLSASLRQNGKKTYAVGKSLRVQVALDKAPELTAVNVVRVAGPKQYSLCTLTVDPATLSGTPLSISAGLADVAEGRYLLSAEILDGDRVLTRLASPLAVVKSYQARRGAVEAGIRAITDHAAAKDTILYPFSLADGMSAGRREVLDYDFPGGIKRSEQLLAALKNGQDLIYQATGDVSRAYFFAEGEDRVPFRIFVPSSWSAGKHLPVIVALHGANLDENNFLSRAGGLMAKLAESGGYIVVCPLGFRMNSLYGAPSVAGLLTIDRRRAELSEKDVLNVTAMVMQEYGGDPNRLYLMGNSMGAMGTYHIAGKYPQMWTAIAPCAAGNNEPDDAVVRLRELPILTVTGDLDFMHDPVLKTVARLRQLGMTPQLIDVPGGTHGTAIEIALPKIFEFFAQHQEKKKS